MLKQIINSRRLWALIIIWICPILSSCQYLNGLLPQHPVRIEKTYETQDQSTKNVSGPDETAFSEPEEPVLPEHVGSNKIDEPMIDEPTMNEHLAEENTNASFFQELSNYLNMRVLQFNPEFNARLGVLVFNQRNRDPVFSYHADECFIPASLTKVIVCSAFIQILQADQPYENLSESFEREKVLINWHHEAFIDVAYLLKQINSYTFHQAPRANRTANALGQFLQQIYEHKHQTGITLESLLLDHLDQVSFIANCNQIENASGLTLNNRLTPFQVADCMFHLKDFPAYMDSLMHSGQGTLENRLKGVDVRHRFKTGSLKNSGVLCLAGFLDFNAPVGFIFIINELPRYMFEACQNWMDETVITLTEMNKEIYYGRTQ